MYVCVRESESVCVKENVCECVCERERKCACVCARAHLNIFGFQWFKRIFFSQSFLQVLQIIFLRISCFKKN